MTVAIAWLTRDLRLRDNSVLHAAADHRRLLPVVVEPASDPVPPHGFPRMGHHRRRFFRESCADLHHQLAARGSGLHIASGDPAPVLSQLADTVGATHIYTMREAASEERARQERVRRALPGIPFHTIESGYLFDSGDLPFDPADTPDIFTDFRKRVERHATIREPLPVPDLPPLPDGFPRPIEPATDTTDPDRVTPDMRAVHPFPGGERAAWKRIRDYFWKGDHLHRYKETRNGLLGANFSTKFSPWLALGCLSPRDIHREVIRYESERVANRSTYWLVFELLWREYFHWLLHKYGDRFFHHGGIRGRAPRSRPDPERILAWCEGCTGVPFVDANMRELNDTGYMSNRGRQNVASFLVKDLKQDWRVGAEYFESRLLDYDVASNWGNWNYVAGVGTDPREDRYFNVLLQARRYDPEGSYVRHWLPELSGLPGGAVHAPFRLDDGVLNAAGIRLGRDYPRPIVRPRAWERIDLTGEF